MGSDGVITKKQTIRTLLVRSVWRVMQYLMLLRKDRFMMRDSERKRCRIVYSGRSDLELQ
jgi:hypothetical protein